MRDKCRNPIFIIEVKRQWEPEPAMKDLKRIAKFQANWGPNVGGTLRGGFFAFMFGENRGKMPHYLSTRQPRIVESARQVLVELGYKTKPYFGDVWQTCCDEYVKKGRKREGCAACIQLTS